VGREKKLVI